MAKKIKLDKHLIYIKKSLGFPIEIETKRKFKAKRKYALGERVGYDDLIYEPLDKETEKIIEKFEESKRLIYSLPNE